MTICYQVKFKLKKIKFRFIDLKFESRIPRTTAVDVGAIVVPGDKQSTEGTVAGECGHYVTQRLHVDLSGAFLHVVVTLGVVELGQLLVFLYTVGEQCPPCGVHKRVAGFVLFLKLGENSGSQYHAIRFTKVKHCYFENHLVQRRRFHL